MNDFRARLLSHLAVLRSLPERTVLRAEIGDPVSDEEISEVHSRLGFELSPEFLEYFRSVNGWTVLWVAHPGKAELPAEEASALWDRCRTGGGPRGFMRVRPLREIFSAEPTPSLGVGDPDSVLPLLGGVSDAALRAGARALGDVGDIYPGDGYDFLAVFASRERPDPVCLLAHDYGAALCDHRPVLARTYFELSLFELGDNGSTSWFLGMGAPGDHELVAIPASELPSDPRIVVDPDAARAAYTQASWEYLRTLAKLPGASRTRLPVRRWEERFDPKPRLKLASVVEALEVLGLFEERTVGGDSATLVHGRTGPDFADCACHAYVSPPYGKKSPEVVLTYGSDMSRAELARIREALRAIGMTPRA